MPIDINQLLKLPQLFWKVFHSDSVSRLQGFASTEPHWECIISHWCWAFAVSVPVHPRGVWLGWRAMKTSAQLFIYCSPSERVHQILSSQVDSALTWWETTRLQLSLQKHRGKRIQNFIYYSGCGDKYFDLQCSKMGVFKSFNRHLR